MGESGKKDKGGRKKPKLTIKKAQTKTRKKDEHSSIILKDKKRCRQ